MNQPHQPSQGTIVGAAVGASIAGLAAGAAGLRVFLRARKKRRQARAADIAGSGQNQDLSWTDYTLQGYWDPSQTKDRRNQQTSELQSTQRIYQTSELISTAVVQPAHELPDWGRENRY